MRSTARDQQRSNPFDLTKASDYSDAQVKEYWVDVPDGDEKSLVAFIKPKSPVPIFLLGGKGSGKTHLLRYCSSAVQELRYSSLRKAIETEGYIGTYASADGLNVHRFTGKGQSEETWLPVFAYSFELWLAISLFTAVKPALTDEELTSQEWTTSLIDGVLSLFQAEPASRPTDFDGLLKHLNALRAQVDIVVNNSAITRQLDGIKVLFNPGDLFFGIPRLLAGLCKAFQSAMFVYLVDEIENLTEQQQRFLNTLVRYRKGNVTLRIGARLYGLKTEATLGSGEPIKRENEYEKLMLDAHLREDEEQYERLVALLVLRRLHASHMGEDIAVDSLPNFFSEVSAENFHQSTALEIVASRDGLGAERPHVSRFRAAIGEVVRDRKMASDVVETLCLADHPLLEKVNLLAFCKRVSRDQDLLTLAQKIKEEALALLESGAAAAPKYYELYSHFSSDLLAQLYRDYGRKPVYAGFKTLVQLSQGVPRNLLNLLKHIHRRSTFAGEAPFASGQISIDSQVQGIYDASEWFWEDAQPDEHGSLVRNAVEHLATLARTIRYSDNPSECDLCCFLVNPDDLGESASQALKMAENWSFLLRVKGVSGAKNDDRVLPKYQINPMLAARWGVSESRRGSLELKKPLADTLLGGGTADAARAAITERTSDMHLPRLLQLVLASDLDDRQTKFSFDDN